MKNTGSGEADAVTPSGPAKFNRVCPTEECRQARCAPLRESDIEILACLAARLAGRNPDEQATIALGGVVAFDDVTWRYPDFLARAEAAYRILAADRLLN